MTVIKRIEINSFGKFKNYSLELKDGLNELVFDNEFGKSTITDFILFILYGFNKTASKKIALEDNLLKKYLPWHGEALLSGALELERDGKFLRIERTQNDGRKKTVEMRDIGGERIELSDSPGKMLFGVDSDTFERTFLIRQTDIRFSGTGGLEAALKNLVTTGDEDTSYEKAASILTDKNRAYRHICRQSGRIFDIQKELYETELEIHGIGRKLDALKQQSEKSSELSEQYSELSDKEARIYSLLPLAKGTDARRTLKKLEEADSELDKLKAEFGRTAEYAIGTDTVADIAKAFAEHELLEKNALDAANELEAQASKSKQLLEGLPNYEMLRENEAEISVLCAKKPTPRIWLCAVGALLLLFGAAALIFGLTVGSPFAVSGIAALAAGAALTLSGAVFKKKIQIPQKYRMTHAQLKSEYAEYKSRRDGIERQKAVCAEAALKKRKLSDSLEESVRALEKIRSEYNITSPDQLSAAAGASSKTAELSARIKALEEKRKELLTDRTEQELRDTAQLGECEFTEREAEKMLLALSEQKKSVLTRLDALKEDERMFKEQRRLLYLKTEQKTELEKELELAKYRDSVLTLAREALEQAHRQFSEKYSPILNERAGKILSEITGGKYESIFVDRDFNLRIKADGLTYDLGYFSRGTADSVYFAVRMAVCDLISSTEGLPMIMDDPFWSLDTKRAENAHRFSENAAKSRQIIIFSARN